MTRTRLGRQSLLVVMPWTRAEQELGDEGCGLFSIVSLVRHMTNITLGTEPTLTWKSSLVVFAASQCHLAFLRRVLGRSSLERQTAPCRYVLL